MDPEELEPKKAKPQPRNLEVMGVEELDAYVAELAAEIERVKQVIAAKRSHRSGADSLFKR
ncbi:MAG: DUF1192 domain-containing protein [Alphaproteobacteria bacterium]